MSLSGPYIWDGMEPPARQRLWDDAISWSDRESAKIRGEPMPDIDAALPPAPSPRRRAPRAEAGVPTPAIAELAELAAALAARGVPAWSALIDVRYRADLLARGGAVIDPALPLYVAAAAYEIDPETWDPLADWSATAREPALAEGIETEEAGEREHTRRARLVASYLYQRPSAPAAIAVVAAAEKILVAITSAQKMR